LDAKPLRDGHPLVGTLRLALQPLEARRNKVASGSSAHSYLEDFWGLSVSFEETPGIELQNLKMDVPIIPVISYL
jgi:hypothetical protein